MASTENGSCKTKQGLDRGTPHLSLGDAAGVAADDEEPRKGRRRVIASYPPCRSANGSSESESPPVVFSPPAWYPATAMALLAMSQQHKRKMEAEELKAALMERQLSQNSGKAATNIDIHSKTPDDVFHSPPKFPSLPRKTPTPPPPKSETEAQQQQQQVRRVAKVSFLLRKKIMNPTIVS